MTKTTRFVWDSVSDSVISELDETNAITATYTNEPQHYGGVISQRRVATTSTLHADALGSTRVLTNSSQAVIDTYLYDVLGKLITTSGTTVNPFRWVGAWGYYYDPETGVCYVRARIYDPNIGRWSSADPIDIPKRPADYLYADNSPVENSDPSGLISVSPVLKLNIGSAHCGDDVGIAWRFHFGNGAPCTGVLFQRVFVFCNSSPCTRFRAHQQRAYIEAWPVTKGQSDVDILSGAVGARWTDAAIWTGADQDTQGYYFQAATIRLFCERGHEDNRHLPPGEMVPKTSLDAMQRGRVEVLRGECSTNAGNLKGRPLVEAVVPLFWEKYEKSEGTAFRHFGVSWRCCCDEGAKGVWSWAQPKAGGVDANSLTDFNPGA